MLLLCACGRVDYSPSEDQAKLAEPLSAFAPPKPTIQVSPPAASIPVNVTVQFTTSLLAHSSPSICSNDVTWAVSDTAVATIDSTGLATAVAPGTATVTASVRGLSATATLTVDTAVLTALDVNPAMRKVHVGTDARFRASGIFSDGTTFPLQNGVIWSSSDASVAKVDGTGRASRLAAGVTAITATDDVSGLDATAFLVVGSASIASLTISPTSASATVGATVSFVATATFTDSSTQDVTDTATWSTADSAVATVSDTGVTMGVAVGGTTVTASIGKKSATATLAVTAPQIVATGVPLL
jgi:trimeric autotransporter adhesin